jgi:hypothetical protein
MPVTAPAYVPAASRPGIEAALAAIADAKSEEEALAAAQRFAEVAAAAFTPGSDPLAFIAAIFDAETAEVVADVGSATNLPDRTHSFRRARQVDGALPLLRGVR